VVSSGSIDVLSGAAHVVSLLVGHAQRAWSATPPDSRGQRCLPLHVRAHELATKKKSDHISSYPSFDFICFIDRKRNAHGTSSMFVASCAQTVELIRELLTAAINAHERFRPQSRDILPRITPRPPRSFNVSPAAFMAITAHV
jgi:hypothetical protein